MNSKEIIDSWIDYVSVEWLNLLKEPLLRPSTENLIRKMERMSSDHLQYDEAWEFIGKLEQLHDPFHDENNLYSKEPVQTRVKCAIAAYKMGNARESTRLFGEAISICTDKHDKAVIRWLRGCVYWYAGNSLDAITDWEDSLNEFKTQATNTQRNAKWINWYLEKIEEMRNAIKYATEHNFPPLPIRAEPRGGGGVKTHVLKFIPIIGEIPAGTPLNVLPNSVDFMSTERVTINNKEYRIVSLLRGQQAINLPPGQRFYILRVHGNSMNQSTPEPIENSDHVILREQNTADHMDIVAALIVSGAGVDDRATLKRFKLEDGKIYLHPESADPEFKKSIYVERSFTKFDDDFQIRGVALAVLKPM